MIRVRFPVFCALVLCASSIAAQEPEFATHTVRANGITVTYIEAGKGQAVHDDSMVFLDRLWRDWSPGWQLPQSELDSVKAVMRRPGTLHAALNYYRENLGLGTPRAAVLDSIRKRVGGK